MKASVLKPVLWSSNGHRGPCGDGATSGYPAKYGFGHEEWNNDPTWTWGGYRVFYTNATPRLETYAKSGELGMLMIASHERQQYAVGVAAGVFCNDEDDKALIARDLSLYENWRTLWDLALGPVRK